MMKIGLYGIGGLYNYGCEAIVRGTEILFHQIYPDAEIIYFSRRAEEDSKIIEDVKITVVQLQEDYSFSERVINKLFKEVGIAYTVGDRSQKQVLESNLDLIVSIGGDIYTIPEHVREQKKYNYYNKLVKLGESALSRGIKFIIYGASIGPFGNYSKAIDFYINHFKKVDLIIAREQKCVDYLKKQGIEKNVIVLPDPAFSVTGYTDDRAEKKYIGINLSPLSIRELNGDVTDDSISILSDLLVNIVHHTGRELLLIPHVFCPESSNDNDYVFMEKIISSLPKHEAKYIHLSKPKNYIDAKRILRTCLIVVTARMHCGINAVSESIPTIFLSYSDKAVGMAKYVYNSEEWVVPLRRITTELIPKIDTMISQTQKIESDLHERIQHIRKLSADSSVYERIREINQ